MSTLYMKAEPDTVAPYVIFSGDPFRVELLKEKLEEPFHVAFSREYNTYTGYYKGVRVTVSSTGIGAPGAAIAMEEMYEAGMKAAVRMGTVMVLEKGMLGRFLIPAAAMREEAASRTYVRESYPAVSDLCLAGCMRDAVKSLGGVSESGIVCSMDGFYSQMHGSAFSRESGRNIGATYERLRRARVVGIDMETSCILTLGNLMGIRACAVMAATVSSDEGEELDAQARRRTEELLCRAALEGILRFHESEKGKHTEVCAGHQPPAGDSEEREKV